MADERNKDKIVERLLSHKDVWPSPGGAEMCPEPVTLAAYFDRSLSAAETTQLEEHLSSCARCREQLAILARTEISVAPSSPEPARRTFWLLNWRWLAPAGAAVLAVVIWIAVRTSPLSVQAPVERPKLEAKVSEQARPEIPAENVNAPSSTPAPAKKGAEKSVASSAMPAPKAAAARAETPQSGVAIGGARSDEFAAAKPAEQKAFDQIAANRARVPAAQVPSAPAYSRDQAQMAAAKESQPTAEAGTKVAQQQTGYVTAEQSRMKDATLRSEPAKEGRAPAPAAAPSETVAVEAAAKPRAMHKQKVEAAQPEVALRASLVGENKMVAREGDVIVPTPNRKTFWRIGPGGSIERTVDAGKTWQQMKSPTSEQLFAGAAPSEKVCWAGGRNGVLLRTIDGEHWELIASPTRENVVSIVARNAYEVTLTGADGRSYETRDAGVLWRQR